MRERERMVGIDELLDLGGEPLADPAEDKPVRVRRRFDGRWWLVKTAQSLGIGAAVWALLYVARFSVPYPLVAAVVMAIVVLYGGLVEVREEPLPPEVTGRGLPLVVDEAGNPGPVGSLRNSVLTSDGLRYAVGRWEDRFVWGERDPHRFAQLVVPRLADIVDERLRQRHSLTRAGDAARVRELLGEDLWAFLHNPPARVPDPRVVASIIARVEEL
jgi:hypothetical protein